MRGNDLSFCFLILLVVTFNLADRVPDTGRHFAAACPWAVVGKTFCYAFITTEVRLVEVSISVENSISLQSQFHNSEKKFYRLESGKHLRFEVSVNDGYDLRRPSVYCPVWIIRATSPIKVILNTRSRDFNTGDFTGDFLNLTPKDKCFKSYFTATTVGYPFITVISFDAENTQVKIKFPITSRKFYSIDCFANVKCSPNTLVTTHLTKYQAWYIWLDDYKGMLSAVIITADHPVNVISGNANPAYHNNTDVNIIEDLTTTSIKPSSTWGKTYILPAFWTEVIKFNFFKTPLTITLVEYKNGRPVTSNRTIEVSGRDIRMCGIRYISISAVYPFGLEQKLVTRCMKAARTGISMLNVIPVEQWKHSIILIGPSMGHDPNVFNYTYILITRDAKLRDITFSNVQSSEVGINWHLLSNFTFQGKYYAVSKLDPNVYKRRTRVYVKGDKGTMMLYVEIRHKSFNNFSLSAFPYDYNQGEIYQKNCIKSANIRPKDGVDNDCDGFLDEEIKNGLDDDGDGKIDEDYIEHYFGGVWTEWRHACDHRCKKEIISVRVRTCLSNSTVSKPCEGRGVQCNGKNCPPDCGKVTPHMPDSGCVCSFNCQTCVESMFECDSCKSGYMPTEHCLLPCPEGWSGYRCLKPDLKLVPRKENVHGENAHEVWVVVVAAFIVAAMLSFLVYGFVLLDSIEEKAREKVMSEVKIRDNKPGRGESSV